MDTNTNQIISTTCIYSALKWVAGCWQLYCR